MFQCVTFKTQGFVSTEMGSNSLLFVVRFQSIHASAGPVIYHICSGAVSGLMCIHIYHLIYIDIEIYLYIYINTFSIFKAMQQMYAKVLYLWRTRTATFKILLAGDDSW